MSRKNDPHLPERLTLSKVDFGFRIIEKKGETDNEGAGFASDYEKFADDITTVLRKELVTEDK